MPLSELQKYNSSKFLLYFEISIDFHICMNTPVLGCLFGKEGQCEILLENA